MRVVAVANQKGGSGKTTTAVNLAAALAERERRVLLIDLDPQGSSSTWLGVESIAGGLVDLFFDGQPLTALAHPTAEPRLAMIPASEWLVGLDKRLAGTPGTETTLRRRVAALPPDTWDYVMLDCPPALGLLSVNALSAARELLIPVEAHVLPLSGLVQLLRSVDLIRERLNPELSIAGILACRVNLQTRHAREVVAELRSRFGPLVFRTVIRENVRLAECPSFAQPITRYADSSAGARDYRALAEEIIEQEGSH